MCELELREYSGWVNSAVREPIGMVRVSLISCFSDSSLRNFPTTSIGDFALSGSI